MTLASRVAPHRGEGEDVDAGAGEAGGVHGAGDDAAEDRLEAVMVAVMEMVGLGRRKEDAVDAAGHQAGQPVGAAKAIGRQDRGQRRLEVGNGGAAGVDRGQRVDQHDLAIEAGEVIAKKGRTTVDL